MFELVTGVWTNDTFVFFDWCSQIIAQKIGFKLSERLIVGNGIKIMDWIIM